MSAMVVRAPLFPRQQAERVTISKTLLHAADISNPCKPWKVSKEWSDRVIEEFFAQVRLKRRLIASLA